MLNPPHLQRMNDRNSSLLIEYEGYRILFMTISPSARSLCMYGHRYTNPDCLRVFSRHDAIFYYLYDKLYWAAAVTNSTLLLESKAVIIFNWGLHINQRNREWLVPIIADVLIRFGKDFKGQYFLFFRETSAQHFAGSIGGNYVSGEALRELIHMGKIGKSESELCCDSFPNDIGESDVSKGQLSKLYNFANRYFIRALEKVNIDFRQYLSIIPFYNFTARLHAFHLEGYKDILNASATITPDCTHFIYVPLLFDGLWREISKAVNSHVS